MFIEKYAIDGAIKDVGDVANSGEKAWHCIKLEEGWKVAKEGWNEAKNLYAEPDKVSHKEKFGSESWNQDYSYHYSIR